MPALLNPYLKADRRLREIILLGGILAFYLLYLMFYCWKLYGGNPSGFLNFSPAAYELADRDPNLIIREDSGYDGQFYYFVALDPFASDKDLFDRLRVNGYRYQRVLYPFLSWCFSFGHREATPLVMIGVNLAALLLASFLLMRICERFDLDPACALFYAFSMGSLVSLLRCTTEPLYLLLLIASFYFFLARTNYLMSALMLSIGALSRELTLVCAAGFVLFLFARREKFSRISCYFIPFAVFLLWQMVIFLKLHQLFPILNTPMAQTYTSIVPLSGLFGKWLDLAREMSRQDFIFPLVQMIAIVNGLFAAGLILFYLVRNWRGYRENAWFFALIGFLYSLNLHPATCAIPAMIDIWGYARHTVEIFLCVWMLYALTKSRLFLIPLWINAFVWTALVVVFL